MQTDQSTKVLCLDRNETIKYLSKLGIEHENCTGDSNCICDSEELQALLLSFCYCVPNFSLLYEIADGFQESFDLVQILVDSNDGRLTEGALQQLIEQENRPASTIIVSRYNGVFKSLDSRIDSTTLIAVTETAADEEVQFAAHSKRNFGDTCTTSIDNGLPNIDGSGACITEVALRHISYNATSHISIVRDRTGVQVIAPPLPFGVNECKVRMERVLTGPAEADVHPDQAEYPIRQQYTWRDTVIVTSAVHRYAAALDTMFDRLYYGWEGNWDQNLENAVLQLLVAVDDDLVGMVRSWVRMMSGGAGSMLRDGASDMQRLLDSVISDVQKAMNEHSTYAVGRLHQTLVQFVDAKDSMAMMMRIPEGFTHAINEFIAAKLEASAQAEMRRDLDMLVRSARDFLHNLCSSTAGLAQKRQIGALRAFLQTTGATATTAATTNTSTDTPATGAMTIELAQRIHELKPPSMEMIATAAIANWSTNKIDLLPHIPLSTVRDLPLLALCAHQLCETLIMDAFNIDTFMGYHMGVENVPESAAIISSLLEVGFAYVTSESGKLMGLLPMERSMLVLNDPCNQVRTEVTSTSSVSLCTTEVGVVHAKKAADQRKDKGNKKRALSAEADQSLNANVASLCVGTKYARSSGWVPITDEDSDTITAGSEHHSTTGATTGAPAPTSAQAGRDPECKQTHFPFAMPPQLRRRAKDMQRVFRNNVKKSLSLRLNSDFDLAIRKLREHHGADCWVGPALQSVWRCMAATSPPQLLIFELWYGEEMIAADYAHPTNGGSSVYVATRFFNRSAEVRNLVPGFLLALVETKFLQRMGCHIWDLGTANLCPLMRYKLDLTGEPYSRPQAFYELARAANAVAARKAVADSAAGALANQMDNLRAGVLIDNITVHDLLGHHFPIYKKVLNKRSHHFC